MKKRNIKEFIIKYKVFILGILIWLIPLGFGSLMYQWWEPAEIIEEETAVETVTEIAVQDTLIVENPEKAAEYAAASAVLLSAPDAQNPWSGSGVIWDQTQDTLIIATSAHLLENVQNKLLLFFDSRQYAEASVLGVAADADVGFVSCQKRDVPADVLEKIRYVSLHQRLFDSVTAGDLCVAVGSLEAPADRGQLLIFAEAGQNQEGIGEDLFLLEGKCEAGMSGSGLFDGNGNLIGMVIASDKEKEDTLAIPMPRINAAYTEITGSTRDTRAYEKG